METLFWCMIGIIIILCISRYNENEKLFWTLLVSFLGTFAAATAVISYVNNSKKNKVEYVSSNPMQVPSSNSHMYCVLAELSDLATYEEKSSEPVGKEFKTNSIDLVLSKVEGGARDQPCSFFDTS